MMSPPTLTMTVDELRSLLETLNDDDEEEVQASSPAPSSSSPSSASSPPQRLLVLDCRPFLAYNEAHVSSAVNAYCPSILLRRRADRGGKLPFHVLIPSADVRDGIRRGHYSTVVLYDELGIASATTSSSSAGGVNDHHSAVRVATRCLSMQRQQQQPDVESGLGKISVFYLDGGFTKFRQTYPHLCVESHGTGTSGSQSPQDRRSTTSSSSMDDHQMTINGNPVYEQGDPVEILTHLFLGSAFHAANFATLDRLGVTALLNVSRSRPALDDHDIERFAYKSIPVDDSNSVDISTWFNEAIQFIDDVKKSGGKVLVHCHAGISRSATICLAYLMFTRRIRLDEAYEYIKTRRSVISPNFNFMGQLLKFESQLMLSPDNDDDDIVTTCNGSSTTSAVIAHCHHHQHHHKQHQHHHHNQHQHHHNQHQHQNYHQNGHVASHQQRFVFDMGVSEDRGYSSSSVASSASLSPSPMLTAPAIMSPS